MVVECGCVEWSGEVESVSLSGVKDESQSGVDWMRNDVVGGVVEW